MKRASSKNDVLVVDLGRSATRLAHIDVSGDFPRVIRFAVLPRDGASREEEVLAAVKKAALQMFPDRRPPVVLTWDEGIVFRQMELPVMPEEDLRKAFDWEMKQKYTLEIHEPVMTYVQVAESETPEGGRERSYTAFYAEKSQVASRLAALRSAGFRVQSIVPSHAALAHLWSGLGGDRDVLIFDIGLESARILVTQAEKNMLARSILLGGDALTEMMTAGYIGEKGRVQLGYPEAERLKVAEGVQNPQAEHVGLIRPYLEKIVVEIKRSVDFYEQQRSARPISKVVFSGGGSDLKGLAGYMNRFLKTPVHVPDPLSFIHPSMPLERQQALRDSCGALSAALGAAITPIDGPNLIPQDLRESATSPAGRLGLRVGAFALLLAMIAADGWALLSHRAAVAQRAVLESQRRETGRVHDLLVDIGAQQRFMRGALKNDLYHPGLLKQLSLSVPQDVSLDELVYSRADAELLLRGKVAQSGPGDVRVLSKLIADLQASPFFDQAQLVSSQKEADGSTAFEIRCRTRGVS